MAGKNSKTVGEIVKLFNAGDVASSLKYYAEDAVTVDIARGETVKGHEGIQAYAEGWRASFPDARITDFELIDSGDAVTMLFTGIGTNTAATPELPATGKKLSMQFCQVTRFGPDGKIVSEELYYDQLTFLQQMGLAPTQ